MHGTQARSTTALQRRRVRGNYKMADTRASSHYEAASGRQQQHWGHMPGQQHTEVAVARRTAAKSSSLQYSVPTELCLSLECILSACRTLSYTHFFFFSILLASS